MASVRDEIELLGEAGYVFAQRVGMSEHRLNRLLKGRVKNISEEDVAQIARGLSARGVTHLQVREELERRAQAHRVAQAQEI
jgi:transcriptional regulator with XRE-family HTH domain